MKNKDINDIVFITSNDFDTLWYQRQALAVQFAKAGYRVFYFNKTPQRWPRPTQVAKWFLKRGQNREPNPVPENLTIVKPCWLVPDERLKKLNRKRIKKTLSELNIKRPIVIADVPSYNTLEVIAQLRAEKFIYSNVHNYDDSNRIAGSIFDSEKAIIQRADFLFATSEYNAERTTRRSNGRKVYRSLPGTDFKLFADTLRGDEAQKANSICFFGTIYDMVDIELYNRLSEKFKIIFIGDIADNVRWAISKKIETRKPVGQKELTAQLRDIDIIGLFYKKNPYTKGVIPAKIFECFATGKPVLVSGLKPDPVYSRDVYHFDRSQKQAVEIIENLIKTETAQKIEDRQATAKPADWKNRFESFCKIIFSKGNLPKFSALICVYQKDNPAYFKQAFESIVNQTKMPDEIVLVKDGLVFEKIENIIADYKNRLGDCLKIVALKKNSGLGAALAEGVKNCSFDIIARCDADDINTADRFERQLKFLNNNSHIDVVSAFAATFDEEINQPLFVRRGPLIHTKIAKQFRYRFCMNHPASMLRKSAVLRAGNYKPFAGLEDYYLWARMLLNGSKMANIGQVLLHHRWQKQLISRRGGFGRAAQQIRLQKEFLKIGFINKFQFVRNVIVRTTAALLPVGLIRKIRIVLGI